MDDYVKDFVQESEEQITELNNALLDLEQDPDDDRAIERVFRTAHTLKGNAGAMGFTGVSDLAHALEDLLEGIRSGALEASPDLMDQVFDGVDELERLVDEARDHGEPKTDPTPTIEQLREYASVTSAGDDEIDSLLRAVDDPVSDTHEVYHARLAIADGAENGIEVIEALDDAFDLLGSDPGRGAIADGEFQDRFDAVFASPVGKGAIDAALDPVVAVDDAIVTKTTDRFRRVRQAVEEPSADDTGTDQSDAVESEPDELDIGEADLSAADMSVDELLADEDVDQFDDLDEAMADLDDDGGDDGLDDLGDAGSFDDLDLGEDLSSTIVEEDEADDAAEADAEVTDAAPETPADAEADAADAASATDDAEASTADADGASAADDEDVEDASETFAELQQEVDPVGFDELQDELAELEFDEFDTDEEVGFDELIGDEVDVEDETFLDFEGEEVDDEALDDLLVDDEPPEPTGADADAAEADAGGGEPDTAEADAIDFGEPDADVGLSGSDDDATADADVGLSGSDDTATADADAGLSGSDDDATTDDDVGLSASDDTATADADVGLSGSDDDSFDDATADDDVGLSGSDDFGSAEADDGFGEGSAETEDGFGDATAEPDDGFGEASADADDGFGSADDLSAGTDDLSAGTDEFGSADDDGFADAGSTDADDFGDFGDYDEFSDPEDEAEEEEDDTPDPVESLEAVTEPVAADLQDAGVETVEDLSQADVPTMAGETGLSITEMADLVEAAGGTVDEDLTAGAPGGSTASSAEQMQSVRVDVGQLDSLMNLVEGLVTSRARLRRAVEDREPHEVIDEELDELEDITAEVQDTVMDVRLVPLNNVTSRLPRIVRDVARDQGKEVSFQTSGEDVELDRTVLSEIGDPLIHLVRNAVDHGIEFPDEREAAGKERQGTIELNAERERDEVVLEVSDDGGGLDPDRLRAEAVSEEILTEEEAAEMTDEEAYDLIFHPGFSTREEITDVSGRGVGMDVVASTVSELDGEVDVESTLGQGTTVRLTLPVTVAIADVLFVEVGGEEYGIPVRAVQEIGPVRNVQTIGGKEVVVTEEEDDDIIFGGLGTDDDEETKTRRESPLLRLDDALETPRRGRNGNGRLVHVREDVRSVVLHCDDIRGRQEVVVKPFEGLLGDIPGLSGAAVLGEGEVVNILDVETL